MGQLAMAQGSPAAHTSRSLSLRIHLPPTKQLASGKKPNFTCLGVPRHLTRCLANRRQNHHLGVKIISLFYLKIFYRESCNLEGNSKLQRRWLAVPKALYSLLSALTLWANRGSLLVWVRFSHAVPLYPALPVLLHTARVSVITQLDCLGESVLSLGVFLFFFNFLFIYV